MQFYSHPSQFRQTPLKKKRGGEGRGGGGEEEKNREVKGIPRTSGKLTIRGKSGYRLARHRATAGVQETLAAWSDLMAGAVPSRGTGSFEDSVHWDFFLM